MTMTAMRRVSADELEKIIERHKKWLRGEDGGERADLSGANLAETGLRGADLSGANLTEACLARANLTRAKLEGAKR